MPMISPDDAARDGYVDRLAGFARERGRNPNTIGIDAIVTLAQGGPVPDPDASLRSPEEWAADVAQWQALGATHLTVNTMGAGFSAVQDHTDALQRFLEISPMRDVEPGHEAVARPSPNSTD